MSRTETLPRQGTSGGTVTEVKGHFHNVMRVRIQSWTCYVLQIDVMIVFNSLSSEYLTSTGALPVPFHTRILTMQRFILVFLPFVWN